MYRAWQWRHGQSYIFKANFHAPSHQIESPAWRKKGALGGKEAERWCGSPQTLLIYQSGPACQVRSNKQHLSETPIESRGDGRRRRMACSHLNTRVLLLDEVSPQRRDLDSGHICVCSRMDSPISIRAPGDRCIIWRSSLLFHGCFSALQTHTHTHVFPTRERTLTRSFHKVTVN